MKYMTDQKNNIEILKKLEQKAKQQRLSIEECRKIFGIGFRLG